MFDPTKEIQLPMKIRQNNTQYLVKSIFAFALWVLLISVLLFTRANAQPPIGPENSKAKNQHDANFPAAGNFNAGVITTYAGATPPPAVIADVTYGFSRKMSVGILAGTTGALGLAGVKVNAGLVQRSNFRVNYRMVVVYYPGRNGKFLFDHQRKEIMPWMLSMAVVDSEITGKKGFRYSLGLGLLETHCVEGMKKYFWGTSDEAKVSPFELFQTLQGSVSMPLSKKLTFRPEVIAIFRDGKLIEQQLFKVSPINPYLKFIYTF
jgi:hypothetical protein